MIGQFKFAASETLLAGPVAVGAACRSRRIELAWAWLSLCVLAICWDISARLDERVSPPRVRIAMAHAADRDERLEAGIAKDL